MSRIVIALFYQHIIHAKLGTIHNVDTTRYVATFGCMRKEKIRIWSSRLRR